MTSDNATTSHGYHTVTPHLTIAGATDALKFYEAAFGAQILMQMPAPDGRLMHASLQIGDSKLMIADDFPEYNGGKSGDPRQLGNTTVSLHLYVEDPDASMERAVAAGATVIMPVQDMFWGDRYGMCQDPFGHRWSLAKPIRSLTGDEMMAAMQDAFSQAPETV